MKSSNMTTKRPNKKMLMLSLNTWEKKSESIKDSTNQKFNLKWNDFVIYILFY